MAHQQEVPAPSCEHFFPTRDYDLDATLSCGQAFRWNQSAGGWESVIAGCWVRLTARPDGLVVTTAQPITDWRWLATYLQTHVALEPILASFPQDEPLRQAVAKCRGLRLLRQDRWECLASFILSATKQIVQIRQIIACLCQRYGNPVVVPPGTPPAFSFPSAARLAACTEAELRACKMGFRAPHLLEAARRVAEGRLALEQLDQTSLEEARATLCEGPGVGPKIADCVLLFSCEFPRAFPVDVWIQRALRQLYFSRRAPSRARLSQFIATYFGPNAGYAQQYLFHSIRRRASA